MDRPTKRPTESEDDRDRLRVPSVVHVFTPRHYPEFVRVRVRPFLLRLLVLGGNLRCATHLCRAGFAIAAAADTTAIHPRLSDRLERLPDGSCQIREQIPFGVHLMRLTIGPRLQE